MSDKNYPYAQCRAFGHWWALVPWLKPRKIKGALMTFECHNCDMVREDFYDRSYNLTKRVYHQPKDYKAKTRKRSEWRKVAIKQAMGGGDASTS